MSGTWIPLFPLEIVLFPGGELPLHIREPCYRKMIGRCMRERENFGTVRADKDLLASIGCEATVVRLIRRYPDGRFDIISQGLDRIRVLRVRTHRDEYLEGEVLRVEENAEESDHALEDRIEEQYRRFASMLGEASPDPPPRGPRWSFRLAERLQISLDARQELLEMMSENARMKRIKEHLRELIPLVAQREKMQGVVRGNGRLRRAIPPGGPQGPEESGKK